MSTWSEDDDDTNRGDCGDTAGFTTSDPNGDDEDTLFFSTLGRCAPPGNALTQENWS